MYIGDILSEILKTKTIVIFHFIHRYEPLRGSAVIKNHFRSVFRHLKFSNHVMKCYLELNDLGQSYPIINNGQPFILTSPSISLLIDSFTMLFNVPENVQRLTLENQITKHKRVTDIFFTRIDLGTVSGLLGI